MKPEHYDLPFRGKVIAYDPPEEEGDHGTDFTVRYNSRQHGYEKDDEETMTLEELKTFLVPRARTASRKRGKRAVVVQRAPRA